MYYCNVLLATATKLRKNKKRIKGPTHLRKKLHLFKQLHPFLFNTFVIEYFIVDNWILRELILLV